MAKQMAAGMPERLERLETKVDHLELRFDRLEARFDVLETRFDVLETRFDRLETRFDMLATRMDVQTESVRTDIRTLADFIGGVIERLDRQHAESQAQTGAKFDIRDLVLQDHTCRITSLEKRRPS